MGGVQDIVTWGFKKALDNYKNKEYKDKKVSTIKEDVQNEFKKVDKWWYRDDQEIWQAWMNIIDRYIWEMENQKLLVNWKENLYYKQAALKSFRESRNKLIRDYNAAKGLKLTTSSENRKLINDVAQRIDNAENEALRQIKYYCNPRQEQTNAIEASKKWTDAEWREIEQKPMFTEVEWDNRTFSLEFTDRSDKIPIHEALKWLFKKNYVYKIDYTNCKNERIKKKMMSLTWTGQCWIQFDEEKKTYLLKDKEWNVIPSRALIWNWVRLTRDKLITWDAWNKKKEQLNQLWKIDSVVESEVTPEDDPELKKYTKVIPEKLKNKLRKLWNTEYRKFIIETEKRLSTILKEWKELWYELHSTPVSKLYVSSWLMEVKFINDTAEKEVTIWKDEAVLWEKLYDLLDWNEDEYLEYLTKRVQSKRTEFDELTKRESLVDDNEDETVKPQERLPEKEKSTALYWLWLLKIFIENHRNTEWDSRADNGDKHLSSMIKQIRDLQYTINEKRDSVSAKNLRACIKDSIKKLSKDWSDYVHHENSYEWIFEKILRWTKNEQIASIRTLSDKEAYYDKTESSFLGNEIIWWTIVEWADGITHIEWWLEVNDEKLNEYFKKINTLLYTDVNFDYEWNLIVTDQITNIDALYEASATDRSWEALMNKLIELWMIPIERSKKKDVKNKCREIAKQLRSQQEIVNDNSLYSPEAVKKQEKEEKEKLELKNPKTDDDIKRLQALEYLESHPEEAENIHQKTALVLKNTLKYQWINNIVRSQFAEIFVEEWWWAKWELANIYNDIVWYWFFNLCDSNAKAAWAIAKEIAITVVTMVITQWIGSAASSWLLATLWELWSWSTKIANTVYQLVNIWKWLQEATWSLKVMYRALQVWSLLIEWTAFNAASKVIRNPLEWRKLFDGININPLTRENIQTAAFLWTLSFTNWLAGKLFNKVWTTNICVDFSKWLANYAARAWNTLGELGTELAGMLAAEEIMNITFWHEVIDPETWEIVKSHSLTWPTEIEWWQMIGMILALRTVKPTFWPKIKEKLDNHTLKVCRSNTNQRFFVLPTWLPVAMSDAANNPEKLLEWESWRTETTEIETRNPENGDIWTPAETETVNPENSETWTPAGSETKTTTEAETKTPVITESSTKTEIETKAPEKPQDWITEELREQYVNRENIMVRDEWTNELPYETVKFGDVRYEVEREIYSDIISEYNEAFSEWIGIDWFHDWTLNKLDQRLKERIILDNWKIIEYPKDGIYSNDRKKSAIEAVKESFDKLSEYEFYKDKIELIEDIEKGSYIIKWKSESDYNNYRKQLNKRIEAAREARAENESQEAKRREKREKWQTEQLDNRVESLKDTPIRDAWLDAQLKAEEEAAKNSGEGNKKSEEETTNRTQNETPSRSQNETVSRSQRVEAIEDPIKRQELTKICESFKTFVENSDISFKNRDTSSTSRTLDEQYYYHWLELYEYLKNFSSWYSSNIYSDPARNNAELIKELWLKEPLNNIYRRCLTLSDKYHAKEISWYEFCKEMKKMFSNMEDTIAHSKDDWFYKPWENRDMPTLEIRDYLQEEKMAYEEALRQEKLAKEEADRLAKEEADRLAKEEADRIAKEEADRLAKEAKEKADKLAKEKTEREIQEAKRAEELKNAEVKKYVSRKDLAERISVNRDKNWRTNVNTWYPEWTETVNWETYTVDYGKYSDIKEKYENAMAKDNTYWERTSALAEVDALFTDRLILDNGKIIKFENELEVAKKSFERLNELDEYKWRIELVQIENSSDCLIKFKEWKEGKKPEEHRKAEEPRKGEETSETEKTRKAEEDTRTNERTKRRTNERSRWEDVVLWEMKTENLKYMEEVLNNTVDENRTSYNLWLEAWELKYETERLKNKMAEVLWRYKVNEWYEIEINEITSKFNEIKDRYEWILKKYEKIQEGLDENIKRMNEFIESWRTLDRKYQKLLSELVSQQNELIQTTENIRWRYWELEITMKELKEMSTWIIYGIKSKYEWSKIHDREYMAHETERNYERGDRIAYEIKNKIGQSRDLIEIIYQRSIKN